jgi:hypothetical protein
MCGDGKAVREYGVAAYLSKCQDQMSHHKIPKEKEKME